MFVFAAVFAAGSISLPWVRRMQVTVLPVSELGFGEMDIDGTASVTIEYRVGCIAIYRVSPR